MGASFIVNLVLFSSQLTISWTSLHSLCSAGFTSQMAALWWTHLRFMQFFMHCWLFQGDHLW